MGKHKGYRNYTLRLITILPFLWAGFFLLFGPVQAAAKQAEHKIRITKQDLSWIGHTIFQKECGGSKDKLMTWNTGEDFASLGIGHFIWYPEGKEGPFEESFPMFLSFMKEKGRSIPAWLEDSPACPWSDRLSFYGAENSWKMKSLKSFMARTMTEQTYFIVVRLKKAFPKMMAALPQHRKKHVINQFFRVADSSQRLYAMIDYVNFKGEGVRRSERYNNQGWGLLQVLEEMKGTERGDEALHEFARAAETVLTRRVANAPKARNEQRWLPGWKNRVNAYRYLACND